MSLITPLAFLRHVLPADGYKAATVFTGRHFDAGGKVRHRKQYNKLFPTIEELAAYITAEDANGNTVYHACATFVDPKGIYNERKKKWEVRTQANAYGARAFWLDIDAGAGKPYVSASDAAEAVVNFCRSAQLPIPLFVGSGSGIHTYWPLSAPLQRADWERYAAGLRALTHQYELRCDHTRTVDIASILRTPGTQHRKTETPRPVICESLPGPYPLEAFGVLINVAHPSPAHAAPKHEAPAAGSLAAALANVRTYEPVHSELLAQRCAQIAHFRDTRGCIAEPLWYAALGVVAFAADGDRYCHEWSSGHPTYSGAETSERIDRVRALTGATTCDKFHALNPTLCQQCPQFTKIKSPIVLGKIDAPAPQPAQIVNPALFGEVGGETIELPELPIGYAWNGLSLVYKSESRDGEPQDILISKYPIYLDTIQLGEIRSEYSFTFQQWIPEKGWFDIIIGAKTLVGTTGMSELADRGANIHDGNHFIKYVRHAVDKYRAERDLALRYDQFGWKDDDTAFLYGKRLYVRDDVMPAVGNKEIETRSQWLMPVRNGSLDGWRHAANSLFAAGCEAQSVALLASFAAPLMRFHSTDEGGAILSLVSRESGTGKTTALTGVTSVWGINKGLAITNIDTKVSKAVTLGALGNLPVIYDELQNRDPEVVKEFVIVFTNGRDKMRGTTEGDIRHTSASWQTLLVSTANTSLVELLNSVGGTDAPSFRVIELNLHVPSHLRFTQGDRLRKELEANAGYAGDAYMRYLVQPDTLAWTKRAIAEWTQQIWDVTQLKAQHRFWVRTVGSMAVAAAIVNKLGLLEFSPDRILEWLVEKLKVYGQERVVTGVDNWAVLALGEFLNEHINDVLIMAGPYKPTNRLVAPIAKPMRKLLIRYEIESQRMFISERHFREWLIRKEIGGRECLMALKNIHIVTDPRRYMTLSAGTDLPGGQIPVVEVNGRHPALSGFIAPLETLKQNNVVPMRDAQ